MTEVESEKHFMLVFPLCDDMRFELFERTKNFIDDFDTLDINSKCLRIMSCDKIKSSLSYSILNFFNGVNHFVNESITKLIIIFNSVFEFCIIKIML